jgi:hypothetical protein
MRAFGRDLIRGGHYGQRSCEPHLKAEHMAAPTNAAYVKKDLANSERRVGGISPFGESAPKSPGLPVRNGRHPCCRAVPLGRWNEINSRELAVVLRWRASCKCLNASMSAFADIGYAIACRGGS